MMEDKTKEALEAYKILTPNIECEIHGASGSEAHEMQRLWNLIEEALTTKQAVDETDPYLGDKCIDELLVQPKNVDVLEDLYTAMGKAFDLGKNHDDGMVIDDTQVGVEFAFHYLNQQGLLNGGMQKLEQMVKANKAGHYTVSNLTDGGFHVGMTTKHMKVTHGRGATILEALNCQEIQQPKEEV